MSFEYPNTQLSCWPPTHQCQPRLYHRRCPLQSLNTFCRQRISTWNVCKALVWYISHVNKHTSYYIMYVQQCAKSQKVWSARSYLYHANPLTWKYHRHIEIKLSHVSHSEKKLNSCESIVICLRHKCQCYNTGRSTANVNVAMIRDGSLPIYGVNNRSANQHGRHLTETQSRKKGTWKLRNHHK